MCNYGNVVCDVVNVVRSEHTTHRPSGHHKFLATAHTCQTMWSFLGRPLAVCFALVVPLACASQPGSIPYLEFGHHMNRHGHYVIGQARLEVALEFRAWMAVPSLECEGLLGL